MKRKYEDLEKLAELKEKGVIDEREFYEEKNKILNKNNNSHQTNDYYIDENIIIKEESSNNYGLIGLILAIISLLTPIQIVDLIIGIVAIFYSYKGVSVASPKKIAIAAIIVSIIATFGALTAPFISPEIYIF